MNGNPVVIVGARRTPLGAFRGSLENLSASALGGAVIRAVTEQPDGRVLEIAEVYMGCVLSAGQGQAPARQAALAAGLAHSAPCTTVNKMCGSGMKAVMLGWDALHARPEALVVAGGMESMSNAPYLLLKARMGMRLGHGTIVDHMLLDGLEDAYEPGRLMGTYAEDAAEKHQFSREAQDEFALASITRARKAQKEGAFVNEIVPIDVTGGGRSGQVQTDEQRMQSNPDGIKELKPAFRANGTVTAANSSSISDGAAALLLAQRERARCLGLAERASIVACTGHAHEPSDFTTAPVQAIRNVLKEAGWTLGTVDLFEVNEAFAVVPLIALKELSIPLDILNVHGGACALGHPIGASGARIIVTLLHALERRGLKRGVAAICLGGGEALALAIERDDRP